LQWQGEVSIPLGQSTGRVTLSDLNLRKLWEYGEPWLAFELKDGRLLVEAEYHLNWKDALSYSINNAHVSVSGVSIAAASPTELADTSVDFKQLDITTIAVDSAAQHITVDAVTLDALAVAGWMEGSRISLQDLFAMDLPAGTEDKDDAENATPWTLALGKAQLRNSGLSWRSEFTEPQLLKIQPLDASLKNLRWPFSGDSVMSLQLSINEQAHIAASGTLALEAGNGSIDFSLQGLPLTWANPNLPKALRATITDGEVEIKGQVALQEFAPTIITLAGNIRDFSARQQQAEDQLTGFDLLRIDGLAVDMVEHNLVLDKLAIDSYTGRLHINEDGSINASKIWQAEVGEQAEEIAEDLTQDKPWSFSLPLIDISDSSIDFMDQSLPIQFRTVIGDLHGEVRNLGSDPATAATVELAGSVDGYAPVTLTGEVTPMATPANLDLTLVFDGVDMALLSPYSGTYAGYVIERGLLDLKLHYALKNNQLQGDNAVRVEKLKLGEKIASDKAVDLPLELALAILTDSNGVIDMAIPVTGDVNNPGFDLSGVITDAIVNLLTKAITAPFTLLANLVSSEDDLQRITFSSGSATLSKRNAEKLTELAAALGQRPNLSLTITGSINATTDTERLQRNKLDAVLIERGLTTENIKAKGPEWEVAIADLYSALPARSANPAAPTPREQYGSVAESITVSDDELTALASRRAVAVKAYLVNEAGLDAARAVVAQADLQEGDDEFSGVELGIAN
jgi:outer membrane protein OmpA-like peptidoglycan-associated protein